MPQPCRLLVILALVLAIGFSGCALPASAPLPWAKAQGYQQTTILIDIPAILAAGGVFAIIDLLILPFQAIFGSGNFFPLLGTMTQILQRLLGDDEPPAKAQPPPRTKTNAQAAASPSPDATRPR